MSFFEVSIFEQLSKFLSKGAEEIKLYQKILNK